MLYMLNSKVVNHTIYEGGKVKVRWLCGGLWLVWCGGVAVVVVVCGGVDENI